MGIVNSLFGGAMRLCYDLCGSYGIAILVFTLLSKVILLPLSIWVQKNSIKMVKIQPEINRMKAKYYGDQDTIAEEQAKLFKREKYSPLATLIPTIAQLVLLMGVIEAIKSGINDPAIDMNFLGMNLSHVPSERGGLLILSPVMAGLSAWLMCAAQNASNVLQSEQGKGNQWGMLAFSVGLSLYLGWFVPVGVCIYWVASNLLAIVQLYLLNWAISPKKYVDYAELEASKKELAELEQLGKKGGDPKQLRANRKREKADYKRFFSIANKHIVFYSESSGFYKYYRGIIEYLLAHTNLTIHYITSDPKDVVFEIAQKENSLKPYYIGEKRLITMMMKMEADMVLMTMPDLENFHIKRSYVQKDIEYVYIPHGMDSLNMTMRTGSVDHYDTVFCVGKHQKEEIRETEAAYGLPAKKLVDWGYSLLDEMRADYAAEGHKNGIKTILIAPSWQPDNIVDSCLEEILEGLKKLDCQIVVRPHPQHVRHKGEYIEQLKQKYAKNKNITIQTDFSSNSTVFSADLVITDWSGIAYEYAYTTLKPVLFINTPMKVMNPEYEKIGVEPINIFLRDKIGVSLDLDQLAQIDTAVKSLLDQETEYHDKLNSFVHEYVYNLDCASEIAGKYIIQSIQKKIKTKKEK